MSAFSIAASQPWLIQPESLEMILSIAQRHHDPSALLTRQGQRLEGARTVRMVDGVAVIPVTGAIFRYANLFTDISGATSTQVLATDIRAAIDNPFVRGLVLDMNSPGGEATGINELASTIYQGRARKPIVAYGGGSVCSACYWLAAAASEIVIDPTALVGSIGVVMSYLDTSKLDERTGVRRVDIVSSVSPDKRIDPGSDEGRAKVQSLVDALAEVFVGAVAKYRNTTPEKVAADYGRGGVLVGQQARAAGMVDRIGSLDGVIAELSGRLNRS